MATRDQVIEALKTVYDPEIMVDVWTLGLIYDIKLGEERLIDITMTFTSIACPAGPELVDEIKTRLLELEEVADVNVTVVFNPPWQPSEELKAMMGIG